MDEYAMSKSRARVKVKKPTTRAQAVAEFGRKKARQRRQQLKRQAMMIVGGTMLSYVVVGTGWMIHTGKLAASVERTTASFWQSTASLGFRVDQVTLTGRKHADAKQIKAALGISQGSPILAVSLADMQARLMAIPEVKSVQIDRALPNQLTIAIAERVPVAWWQQGGALKLIDADGVVLAREKYSSKMTLPVVVGEDAPKHVAELIALLDSAPSLKHDVVAAVRVGQRRWNLEMARELVVMLPEEKPGEAWKRFATLAEKEALLSKAIRSVDMRVEDRVFIMPIEQNSNPITLTTARET
jgi:cell division protein FtsQ